MKNKDLLNKLKSEGKSFVPDVKEDIYASLGISLNMQTSEDIEKALKKEAKVFVPNDKEAIYRAIGISQNAKVDTYNENRIKEEGKTFVPNVKKDVYEDINKKSPSSFMAFLRKPATIAITASVLFVAIAGSVAVPVLLNMNKDQDEDHSMSNYTVESTPANGAAIDLDILSASQSYQPKLLYNANAEGNVDNDTIVPLNDASSNILNNIEGSTKNAYLGSTYDVNSFTLKYLSVALNLGYIERQNISLTNVITIKFTYDKKDKTYIDEVSEAIKASCNDFFYNNKIVANLVIESEEAESEIEESTKNILIRQLFNLCNKLFVDENGNPIKLFCFSTNIEDWINQYKDTPDEKLKEEIDFLLYIESKITTDENRANFVKTLKDIDKYYTALEDLENTYLDFYNKYETLFDLIFEGDDFEPRDDDFGKPWDFDDYSHGDHGHGPQRHPEPKYDFFSYEEYLRFKDDLSKKNFDYDENIDEYEASYLLMELGHAMDDTYGFYVAFNIRVEDLFDALMLQIDEGYYYEEEPDYGDHYHPEPDNWDQDFEDYWHNHHEHH